MKWRYIPINFKLFFSVSLIALLATSHRTNPPKQQFITYTVDPGKQEVALFWKDDAGKVLGSLGNLKKYTAGKNLQLLFAANGGMYTEDQAPLGLFIQQGKLIKRLNRSKGYGNFYLQPNGVFYLTRNKKAVVCTTKEFRQDSSIQYATQSGPMLLIDGALHPAFKKGSDNVNIRNGVGILPGNKVVFAMSKDPVNLYDFASYFKEQGCNNALYLDGFVSRTYLPEKNWVQTDGNFGVMIGVTKLSNTIIK